jgi:hypothetical protein
VNTFLPLESTRIPHFHGLFAPLHINGLRTLWENLAAAPAEQAGHDQAEEEQAH